MTLLLATRHLQPSPPRTLVSEPVHAIDERLVLLVRTEEAVYTAQTGVYTRVMSKRLVDIDDEALDAARAQLGTTTIKDTVNEALRRAGGRREDVVAHALDALGGAPLADRAGAWR